MNTPLPFRGGARAATKLSGQSLARETGGGAGFDQHFPPYSGPPEREAQHPVSDTLQDVERALAPLLARLAALEAKVEALQRQNVPPAGRFEDGSPTCGSKLDQLTAACRDLGITISGDGWIREHGAARLLGRSAFTLRNWRYAERPLPYRILGGRIEYRLADLADWLDRTEAH